MYNLRIGEAEDRFSETLLFSKEKKLFHLEKKVAKQIETLNIFKKQKDLEEVVERHETTRIKTGSIQDILGYLQELTSVLQRLREK